MHKIEKMEPQAPKPEVPKSESKKIPYAASSDNNKPENSFKEIVKGYMLLALTEHGIDLESISFAKLDAVYDGYTKDEAAEMYRKEYSL